MLVIPMPLNELVDRWTIAKLKLERITQLDPAVRADLQTQVETFPQGFPWVPGLPQLIEDLYALNGQMWDTEGVLRRAQEGELDLAEIGRIALRCRDINRQRCKVKNAIVELCGQGYRDLKEDYAPGTTAPRGA